MEVSFTAAMFVLIVTLTLALPLILKHAWTLLNWLWLRPKRLERVLREQGLQGNPYRLLVGDSMDMLKLFMETKSQPTTLSHDNVAPHLYSFNHHILNKFGKNCFVWDGPAPKVIITDPEQIKEVFNKIYDFEKPKYISLVKLLATGLVTYEGEKWAQHRKIINPAFRLEKLKNMLPTFFQSCNEMISRWEGMLSSDGKCEIDVWPFLKDLSSDVISRTAFGSSYEEGRRIFELIKEQTGLLMKLGNTHVPGWWLLPITIHRRMKKIDRDIQASLKAIINKKEEAMKAGEATSDDLLGILLESNHNEIQGNGNNKVAGMTNQEVIDECKLFYIAGQETTSVLLVWTTVLLSRYPNWQARARDEVMQIFSNQKPDFNGLSQLKIVTMILYEVLRLYPPTIYFNRVVRNDVKLGNLSLPAGTRVSLPILILHHDPDIWGDDAKEFKPERFSEGVAKATRGQVSYYPFGWGPRICIGQNFAMLEVKMALSLLLQHFSFELSPAYAHAPTAHTSLQPKYGVHIILQKL